jgi:type I thyroxine 5'-deiodinase
MKLSIPFLIDDMEDTANKAYSAWPDRIYIVGKDGKIAYKGSPGPQGFKPDEAKAKLKEILGK